MKTEVSIPELALIAGTRVALGVGIGLLVAHKLNRDQRRSAGLALLALGAISTVPLAIDVFKNRTRCDDRRILGD
jgi:hypothetical protein